MAHIESCDGTRECFISKRLDGRKNPATTRRKWEIEKWKKELIWLIAGWIKEEDKIIGIGEAVKWDKNE